MGEANVAKHIHIRFEPIGDNVVCLVDVTKSTPAVYADTIKGREIFYVRVGNSTRILSGSEMVRYIENR